MPANPPTKQAARLPKAFIAFCEDTDAILTTSPTGALCADKIGVGDKPVVLVPARTVTEARALIRVAGFFAMGEAEQVEAIANVVLHKSWPRWQRLEQAKAVLTLIASGGARK